MYKLFGVALNNGIPAKRVMAELFRKSTGCSQGKSGSMLFSGDE